MAERQPADPVVPGGSRDRERQGFQTIAQGARAFSNALPLPPPGGTVLAVRPFPVGIDDFRMLREQGLEYVDKSHLIREVIDQGAAVLLLPRPRRFVAAEGAVHPRGGRGDPRDRSRAHGERCEAHGGGCGEQRERPRAHGSGPGLTAAAVVSNATVPGRIAAHAGSRRRPR